MFTAGTLIDAAEKRFGKALVAHRSYTMQEPEFLFVRSSMRKGRAHDVTVFIRHQGQIALIQKWSYPPEAYRPPSGGLEPGEDFEAGAKREMYEETGLLVELERYLCRVHVDFHHGEEVIHWTTHVFSGIVTGGVLVPVDTHEIKAARFATPAEMLGKIKEAMLSTGSTGLQYRQDLNELVLPLLFSGLPELPSEDWRLESESVYERNS